MNAGGIAGACSILGLFVPLYCLVAGFGLKEATALSQAAIAGALVRCIAYNVVWQALLGVCPCLFAGFYHCIAW
jgi:hypothetical protein